jgi:hypothetical protein
MFLEMPVPSDKETLAGKRDYRELMTHDGTKTYLVHSTTPDQAKKIMQEGLNALGTHDNPKLEATVVMLAGPEDIEFGAEGPSWQANPEFEPQEPHNLSQAIGDMALR